MPENEIHPLETPGQISDLIANQPAPSTERPKSPNYSEGLSKYLKDNGIGQSSVAINPHGSLTIQDELDLASEGFDVEQDHFKKGKITMGDFRDGHKQNQFYDRYKEHGSFDELGFNPFRDNEKLYNEKSGFMGDFSRTFGQFSTLVGVGFMDAASFGFSGGVTDNEAAAKMEQAMTIGSSSKGGVGAFTNNLFLNSGYTVGIMAELAAEEVAMAAAQVGLAAAGLGTGGAAWAGNVAVGARMGTKAVSAAAKLKKAWGAMSKIKKTLDGLKDVNQAKAMFAKAGKGLFNILNPLENTIDFVKKSKGLKQAGKWDNITNFDKAFTGAGEFYKDIRNVRLSWGESALEGGMVENQMQRDLLQDFKDTNGRSPNATEAEEIRDFAAKAGATTTFTNAPVIFLSNKITFDGLVRGKFRRLRSDVISHGANGKIIFNPKKGAGKAYSKMSTGYLARKKQYLKNPKLLLTNFGKYGQANFAEGLQELAQESISATNIDYYTNRYKHGNAARGSYMNSLAMGLDSQMSAQGLETFLSGFLMGGMAAPLSNVISTATQGKEGFRDTVAGKVGGKIYDTATKAKYKNDPKKWEAYTAQQKDIATKRDEKLQYMEDKLNDIYADPRKYFAPDLMNLLNQTDYRAAMKEAEGNGNLKDYMDIKDSAEFEHILVALQSGRMDNFVQRMTEMKNLSAEDIQKEYGIDKQVFDASLDKSIARAKGLESRYKEATEKYPNPFDPYRFKTNSQGMQEEAYKQKAWNDAVQEMVFNRDAFDQALNRQASILENAKKVSGLEKTPYAEFNVMFDRADTAAELGRLRDQIGTAATEETAGTGLKGLQYQSPETKAAIRQLERKHKKLEAFGIAIDAVIANADENEQYDSKDMTKLRTAFKAYAQHLSDKNGDFTNRDALNETLDGLVDYYMLKTRSKKANNAVNVLSDPNNFITLFDRLAAQNKLVHKNRRFEIRASLEAFEKLKDTNKLLGDLADLEIFINPKELKALKETGNMSEISLYQFKEGNDGNSWDEEAEIGSDQYNKAIAAIELYVQSQGHELSGKDISERAPNKYMTFNRQKHDKDNRTYRDFAKQFGFDPEATESQVPLANVLQSIIDSEFSEDRDVALAAELLKIAHENEHVTFTKGGSVAGLYSTGTGNQTTVDARYSSRDYTYGKDGHPFESMILHQEILRRTTDSLQENSDFKKEMTELFNLTKEHETNLTPAQRQQLIGHTEGTLEGTSDLAQFTAAAMTNQHFQRFLATIEYDKIDGKSVWEKFVDSVIENIKKILGDPKNGTVLNAALETITAHIDGNFTEGTSKPRTKLGDISNQTEPSQLPTILANELVTAFKAKNEGNVINELDPLLEGANDMSNEEILMSPEFEEFLVNPDHIVKENAIADYNKTKQVEKEQTAKDAKERKAKVNAEPTDSGDIITTEMRDELESLGYLNIKNVNLARELITEGINKEQRDAEEQIAQQSTEDISDEITRMQKEVADLFNNAETVDDVEAAEKDVITLLMGNDQYALAAGINGETVQGLKDKKLAELEYNVNFDNIVVGEVVIMSKYGTKADVISKTNDTVTVQLRNKKKTKLTIKKSEVTNDSTSKFKYTHQSVENQKDSEIKENVELSKEDKAIVDETTENIENANTADAVKEDIVEGLKTEESDLKNDLLDSICK